MQLPDNLKEITNARVILQTNLMGLTNGTLLEWKKARWASGK